MNTLSNIFLLIVFFSLLVGGIMDFPQWGDPQQPASIRVSPRYIEKSIEETGVPNIVTAVLADYRGYDTLFETSVIFTAALVVMILLRKEDGKGRS